MKKSIYLIIPSFLILIGLCGIAAGAGGCFIDYIQATSDCGTIHLTWSDSSLWDHYNVYRSITMGGQPTFLASTQNQFYDDTNVVSGTTYYYEVHGANVFNEEICYSDQASALASSVCVPEFPSMFLPLTMIIGFLGAVLLIQRTREQ
jgi:hypothetical protein